jgi:hypothetical protein
LLIGQQSIKMDGAGRHLRKWLCAPQEGVPDEPFIHRSTGLLRGWRDRCDDRVVEECFRDRLLRGVLGVDGCVARWVVPQKVG